MKKITTIFILTMVLVSCSQEEKKYDYSTNTTFEDGQQDIQPAKIQVIDTSVDEEFIAPAGE